MLEAVHRILWYPVEHLNHVEQFGQLINWIKRHDWNSFALIKYWWNFYYFEDFKLAIEVISSIILSNKEKNGKSVHQLSHEWPILWSVFTSIETQETEIEEIFLKWNQARHTQYCSAAFVVIRIVYTQCLNHSFYAHYELCACVRLRRTFNANLDLYLSLTLFFHVTGSCNSLPDIDWNFYILYIIRFQFVFHEIQRNRAGDSNDRNDLYLKVQYPVANGRRSIEYLIKFISFCCLIHILIIIVFNETIVKQKNIENRERIKSSRILNFGFNQNPKSVFMPRQRQLLEILLWK